MSKGDTGKTPAAASVTRVGAAPTAANVRLGGMAAKEEITSAEALAWLNGELKNMDMETIMAFCDTFAYDGFNPQAFLKLFATLLRGFGLERGRLLLRQVIALIVERGVRVKKSGGKDFKMTKGGTEAVKTIIDSLKLTHYTSRGEKGAPQGNAVTLSRIAIVLVFEISVILQNHPEKVRGGYGYENLPAALCQPGIYSMIPAAVMNEDPRVIDTLNQFQFDFAKLTNVAELDDATLRANIEKFRLIQAQGNLYTEEERWEKLRYLFGRAKEAEQKKWIALCEISPALATGLGKTSD